MKGIWMGGMLYSDLKRVLEEIDNYEKYRSSPVSEVFAFSEWRRYASMSFWYKYKSLSKRLGRMLASLEENKAKEIFATADILDSFNFNVMSFFMDYFPNSLEDIVESLERNVLERSLLEVVFYGSYGDFDWFEKYGGNVIRIYMAPDFFGMDYKEGKREIVLAWSSASIQDFISQLRDKQTGKFDVMIVREGKTHFFDALFPLLYSQGFLGKDALLLWHRNSISVGKIFVKAKFLPRYPGKEIMPCLTPGILCS